MYSRQSLFIYLPTYLLIHLPIYIYIYIYKLIYLPSYLSVYLFIYITVYLPSYLWAFAANLRVRIQPMPICVGVFLNPTFIIVGNNVVSITGVLCTNAGTITDTTTTIFCLTLLLLILERWH